MVPVVLNQVQLGIMQSQKVDDLKQELHWKDLKQMEIPPRKKTSKNFIELNKGKWFWAQ